MWENPYSYTDCNEVRMLGLVFDLIILHFWGNWRDGYILHCYLNQPLNTTGQVGVRVRRAPLFLLSCQWSVSMCLFFLETMKLTFFLLGSNTAREEIIATPCCVCGSAGRKKQWSMWCRFKRQDYDSPYGCCLRDIQAWVIYKNLTQVSSLKLFLLVLVSLEVTIKSPVQPYSP